MIFIVRATGDWAACWSNPPRVKIALTRQTPSLVAEAKNQIDLFCIGDEDAAARLADEGWSVVTLRDGWYADDSGGGVAVWGQGAFWEVRDTPFTIKEAVGPASVTAEGEGGETLDVRRGIFGV
jgi:hypothetical protein